MNAPAPPRPKLLEPGDAAPWFRARALGGLANYVFDTAAGRAILLLFFGTAGRPETAAALAAVQARRGLFDDENACFFGISCDPADAAKGRIAQQLPGIRFFLDHDRAVSRLYGAAPAEELDLYYPHWLVLDRTMRVAARFPLGAAADALAALEAQTA
ncbi:MAG TPA: redoxin domain-containing protein, partial [Allosphingosinicella sp.]